MNQKQPRPLMNFILGFLTGSMIISFAFVQNTVYLIGVIALAVVYNIANGRWKIPKFPKKNKKNLKVSINNRKF